MRYDPKQATESSGSAAPGTYFFKVSNAEEMVAKSSGNGMMKLTLLVDPGNGNPITIYDYLVNSPGGLWKAKLFCSEAGLDFDSGNLTVENCIGRSGRAVFDFDKRDLEQVRAGKQQRAYLKVQRYGVHGEQPTTGACAPQTVPQASQAESPPTGDDIPF